MLYSRVEISGNKALTNLVRGDASGIRAIMESTHEIALQEMEDAFWEIGAIQQAAFEAASPIGKGNPGTLHVEGGTTPPRDPGTLAASWSHDVYRAGGDLHLEVGSDDPVSEYIDKGTGLHATGGTRAMIRAPGKSKWPVPAAHLDIGASRGSKKNPVKDVRFLKKQKGTRAQHLVRQAQTATRPSVGPILRAAAKRAKRDIKAALKAS